MLQDIVGASVNKLSLCPGIGKKKMRHLHNTFHKPFFKKQRKEGKVMNNYFGRSSSTAGPMMSRDVNNKGEGDITTNSDNNVKQKMRRQRCYGQIFDSDGINDNVKTTTK